MSSKDAPNTARLSPADAADLADRVIEHAETWLTRDDRIAPIIVLGGPPNLEQETLRRDDEQRREQAQADLIRDGGPLAAALVAHDLDSAPLLTLLNHTNPGHCIRGANAAEAVWPQVKVSLQVAVIRLRKVNSNASPSTLTPENGAATAEQTEVADVAAGARPSSVPRQVSPARSHSDTVPPVEHLKPSHARAKALYDWAIEHIDGSEDMTYADLFEKLMNHPYCDGEGLPGNAATFARYCHAAGVRRNTPRHEKGATRSVRRVSDL